MKSFVNKIILFIYVFLFVNCTNAYAETLTGKVLDKRGVPVPGMEVRLYHPGPGVSRSRYTNQNGVFLFDLVPRVNGNYDIEYYWKKRLVYRGSISVIGNTRLPPIRL